MDESSSEPLTFGDRMRLAREARQWPQNELARQAQVDAAWIRRLESGERHGIRFDTALRIAEALDVSLDYLAGRTRVRDVSKDWRAAELQVGRRPLLLA